eukprot:Nitzschia sp. Nitz4//scaffold143_size57137//17110//19161//NITZ4_006511-RA/size57137-processed-gene-0.34-mRNA-1//1//CDS//3329536437//2830//frame0
METRQPPPSSEGLYQHPAAYNIPSESDLVLLCLDYLRDLRRAYANREDLLQGEGLDADWLTLAIFALNRSFPKGSPLSDNDAWKTETIATPCESPDKLPSMSAMTEEVVYAHNPSAEGEDPEDEDLEAFAWYDYDDSHPSNHHRFFLLNGLGKTNRPPLLLGELAAAGLYHLQARTRQEAEEEMIASPLFEQFVEAVQGKGFFQDPANETPLADPLQEQQRLVRKEAVYQARYNKVVAKFRTKLALKAEPPEEEQMGAEPSSASVSLSDLQYTRRLRNCLAARKKRQEQAKTGKIAQTFKNASRLAPQHDNKNDIQEAERLKNVGNAHMQQKDYQAAANAYTQALKLSPSGPHSHVYFSNRAAALLSMKQFPEAIADSERSLALKPNYGKAHARLGLAHFLLGDYRQAMEAYTVALKYEPENQSSRSYLEKAAKRLAKRDELPAVPGSSFSVVSEWDRAHAQGGPQKGSGSQLPSQAPSTQDQKEAEKSKTLGNQYMAQRQYQEAYEAYTTAINKSHSGPQSHVYYSNRAAALCYLERYEEAAKDSQASLLLKPTYGKAHARLGLSRFFMNDYAGAIQAYTAALTYDPDNAASKSYLAKAKLKLEQKELKMEQEQQQASMKEPLDDDARRLIHDADMQAMARKAMDPKSSGPELMQDEEMIRIARKAISDPAMLAAVKAVVNN